MTGRTVGQLDEFIRSHVLVASEAPTHIPVSLWFGRIHLAQVAMTIDAIDPGVQVRLVAEIDEIWQQSYGDPLDGLMGFDVAIPIR